LAVRVRSIAHD